MPNKRLLLSLLSMVAVLAFTNRFAVAQARPESDPRKRPSMSKRLIRRPPSSLPNGWSRPRGKRRLTQ